MGGFLGRYEHQLDAKGRISLPSAYRHGEGGRFVLLQWEPPYLTLYPEKTWGEVEKKLKQYGRRASGRAVLRRITSNAIEVTPDKQGRILIPTWLQQAAGLDGTVLMIGALDRIEIWNPDDFGKELERGADEFSDFAAQIFG